MAAARSRWSDSVSALYLTYLELFVIDAICRWFVVSAVVMTALAATTTVRWVRAPAR